MGLNMVGSMEDISAAEATLAMVAVWKTHLVDEHVLAVIFLVSCWWIYQICSGRLGLSSAGWLSCTAA